MSAEADRPVVDINVGWWFVLADIIDDDAMLEQPAVHGAAARPLAVKTRFPVPSVVKFCAPRNVFPSPVLVHAVYEKNSTRKE